jgi:hypothetical protein
MRARDELRSAVKRKGLPTEGIFFPSKFVLRETADRSARDAREKAVSSTIELFARLRKVAEDPNAPSPFAFLSADRCGESIPEAGKKLFLIINNTTAATPAALATAVATPDIPPPESKRIS